MRTLSLYETKTISLIDYYFTRLATWANKKAHRKLFTENTLQEVKIIKKFSADLEITVLNIDLIETRNKSVNNR